VSTSSSSLLSRFSRPAGLAGRAPLQGGGGPATFQPAWPPGQVTSLSEVAAATMVSCSSPNSFYCQPGPAWVLLPAVASCLVMACCCCCCWNGAMPAWSCHWQCLQGVGASQAVGPGRLYGPSQAAWPGLAVLPWWSHAAHPIFLLPTRACLSAAASCWW